MKYIRNNQFYTTEFAWGHLDDMLIAHPDKEHLLKLGQHLTYLFKLVGWIVNVKKSQLTPVKTIMFLGATWTQTNVKCTTQATITLIINHCITILNTNIHQTVLLIKWFVYRSPNLQTHDIVWVMSSGFKKKRAEIRNINSSEFRNYRFCN